ncbi:3752_t:CDS:2 [Rhizophagus irregularis]|nr:3752_t:CDS:2 [Rhizophagus irregularis]
MSDDEIDTEIEEGYDEFIKEYGSRYEWDNERNPDEWRYWDDLFCTIKTYWGTKAVRNWKEKALKQFVHSLPNVRNPSSLFRVFIHSDAFYLPHILSLIELPYYPHKLRWEIWPEGIEKFQCRLFIQGEESIVDYCLKAKKSNDIIKLCKGHFRSEFYSGLTRENMRCIAKNIYYRELVEMLIQAKKESVTGIITGFKDYISQSGIANLNGSKTSDKLEKFLAGGDIILNCFIPGEGVNDIFEVTISNANNNRVSSLAEAIRNHRLDRFQDIDSTSLALYKVGFVADSVIINTLRNNNVFIVDGSVEMEPQDRIFIHFPIQPQRIYSGEKGINVIVYPPTETVPHK